MKLYKIFGILLSILLFSSCEQDKSLDPRPVIVDGKYVALDITKNRLEFDNLATTNFGGLLTTPGNNVEKYELYVRRLNSDAIIITDYKLLLTVNSFPNDLSITPTMIADALGVNVSDLQRGEVYHFRGYATGFDGTVTDYNSLSSTVRGLKGYKQGFYFKTDLEFSTAIPVDNYF